MAIISMALLPCALLAKTFKLQNASIVPGATGEVKTGKDKNGNTKFRVEVKHLANPTELSPVLRKNVLSGGQSPKTEDVHMQKNRYGKQVCQRCKQVHGPRRMSHNCFAR